MKAVIALLFLAVATSQAQILLNQYAHGSVAHHGGLGLGSVAHHVPLAYSHGLHAPAVVATHGHLGHLGHQGTSVITAHHAPLVASHHGAVVAAHHAPLISAHHAPAVVATHGHLGLGHHGAVVAHGHSGQYVAQTRGSIHTAPLPAGSAAIASHHINTAPAPGTL